jgi:hypothetical protein
VVINRSKKLKSLKEERFHRNKEEERQENKSQLVEIKE